MTRYDIRVDRLVAPDLPSDRVPEVGPRVEARLAALARGDAPAPDRGDPTDRVVERVVERVAAEVWEQLNRAREAPS